MRLSIDANLFCWGRYSEHNVSYYNSSFGYTSACISKLDPDIIILHTSFCGLRWQAEAMTELGQTFDLIASHRALKIALPQDEFYLTDQLEYLLTRLNTSILLTCANPDLWNKLYPVLSESLTLKTILTGYVDPKFVQHANKLTRPSKMRPIPISYRAWNAEFWLGDHGRQKVKVGETFRDALNDLNIASDISLDSDDTITGDAWIQFLADSRATIGVEGGSSLVDRDGSLRLSVVRFLEKKPASSFEATSKACFNDDRNSLELKCLSPRHLEAVATRTLQFLVGGEYNGVLKPGRHYVQISSNFDNIKEALSILENPTKIDRITETAYREIVGTGTVSYPAFVAEIEDEFLNRVIARPVRYMDGMKRLTYLLLDWFHWRVIQAENYYVKHPKLFKILSPFKPIYRWMSNQF